MKSSLAVTRRSTVSLSMVAAFLKRSFALAILVSGVGGMSPVWSWYAVRRTKSVESARWLTQWACAVRLCARVPLLAFQTLTVLSREEV